MISDTSDVQKALLIENYKIWHLARQECVMDNFGDENRQLIKPLSKAELDLLSVSKLWS